MSLPEVLEGALDAPGLEALLDDIAATGGLLAVVVRAGRQAEPARGPSALPEVRAALLDGRVPGAQLRYVFEGQEWWDTVLSAGPGRWRVVRIAHGV